MDWLCWLKSDRRGKFDDPQRVDLGTVDPIVEAHRYVDTGRKRGNVVVRIAAQ